MLFAPVLGLPWLVLFLVASDEAALRALPDVYAKTPIVVVVVFAAVTVIGYGWFIALAALWIWEFLWNLFGCEELVVAPAWFTRSWHLGFMSGTRRFQVKDIANMRLREVRVRHGMRRAIVFESACWTVSAAFQVSRKEAAALLSGPLRGLSSES